LGYLQNIELSKEYFHRCSDGKAVGLSFIRPHWLALHGDRIRRQSLRVVGQKKRSLKLNVLHFNTRYINPKQAATSGRNRDRLFPPHVLQQDNQAFNGHVR
jgi:hypothetical protein